MQETWFKDWFNTPYYHQLYKNRDEKEASNFIEKLIKQLNPAENSKILDLACGKGRHSLQLAEKGFGVTGIDLSEASINEALKSEQPNLHFYTHDMRLPFWINYFDYVFNFFTSFGYFKTQREHLNAIQSIAQSLVPGGKFVIDFLNCAYAEDQIIHNNVEQIEDVHYTITRWYDNNKFYKKIIIEDPNVPQTLAFVEMVQKFTLADFRQMFNANGLKVYKVFGDYNFSSYDEKNSPRLIIIAEKKEVV